MTDDKVKTKDVDAKSNPLGWTIEELPPVTDFSRVELRDSTELTDKITSSHRDSMPELRSSGSTNIPVLEFLTGKPFNDEVIPYLPMLRPSCARLDNGRGVTMDSMAWRVTVRVGPDKIIQRITQEVRASLLEHHRYGHDLQLRG
jgi:hypothetical protein